MRYLTGSLLCLLLAFSARAQDTLLLRQPFTSSVRYDSGRCVRYLAIIQGDTSGFRCTVCESSMEGRKGQVSLTFGNWQAPPLAYALELRLLQQVLPLAAQDFELDSLHSVGTGSISQHADLCLAVTRQYLRKFGNRHPGYQSLRAFLATSQLADDFNVLLAPYKRKVAGVSGEKMMLGPKSILDSRAVTGDRAAIPDRVFDGMNMSLSVAPLTK